MRPAADSEPTDHATVGWTTVAAVALAIPLADVREIARVGEIPAGEPRYDLASRFEAGERRAGADDGTGDDGVAARDRLALAIDTGGPRRWLVVGAELALDALAISTVRPVPPLVRGHCAALGIIGVIARLGDLAYFVDPVALLARDEVIA